MVPLSDTAAGREEQVGRRQLLDPTFFSVFLSGFLL
jgi:hypothetical protein